MDDGCFSTCWSERGHWPSMHGDEIRDFFSDSRKTVEILDRKILRALSQSRVGLTLSELMDAAMEEFLDWPASTRVLSALPVKGTSISWKLVVKFAWTGSPLLHAGELLERVASLSVSVDSPSATGENLAAIVCCIFFL
jgi:hypothetical protein